MKEEKKEPQFTLKKYDSFESVFLSWAETEGEIMTAEELREIEYVGSTSDETEIAFSYEEMKAGLEQQGHWGWIGEDKVIHYWIGKEIPLEDLIHFFGHEIAHRTGEPCEDDFQEEMRAEMLGELAVLSYEFAKEVYDNNSRSKFPHESEIDDAIDKLMIIRGDHPSRVRNPLYGEERRLATDLLKHFLLKQNG